MDIQQKVKLFIGIVCIVSIIVFVIIFHNNITYCKSNCEPDSPMGFLTFIWCIIFYLIYRRCTY